MPHRPPEGRSAGRRRSRETQGEEKAGAYGVPRMPGQKRRNPNRTGPGTYADGWAAPGLIEARSVIGLIRPGQFDKKTAPRQELCGRRPPSRSSPINAGSASKSTAATTRWIIEPPSRQGCGASLFSFLPREGERPPSPSSWPRGNPPAAEPSSLSCYGTGSWHCVHPSALVESSRSDADARGWPRFAAAFTESFQRECTRAPFPNYLGLPRSF